MENALWIEAPAKINLTLDVKRKRPDGYHELETVMHKISLADKLCLRPSQNIEVSSSDQTIAWDHTNLVYKAAALILDRYGNNRGVKIFVEKNIPIEAGLAGGSSDAAAVLTGIDRLYGLNIGKANLLSLAAELGSDVAFCLTDGPASALAKGRGEVLESIDFPFQLYLLLVIPACRLSTATVYKQLDLSKIEQHPDHLRFFYALQAGWLEEMVLSMENVLETVSVELCPEIERIKSHLKKAGAIKALMSGSGTCVFGIFADEEKAKHALPKLQQYYAKVFYVSSII